MFWIAVNADSAEISVKGFESSKYTTLFGRLFLSSSSIEESVITEDTFEVGADCAVEELPHQ